MKKYIYIACIAMALVSCDSFLTPDNKTAGGQDASVVLTKNPASLRVYAYSKMKDVVSRTDLYEDGVDLYMPSNKKSATAYDQYTFNPEDDKVKSFYANLYGVINMANAEIYYDTAETYVPEMRFLRDYCYYVLTQQFGSVPYITEYINSANRNYPKTDLLDIYEEVTKDLEEIAEDSKMLSNTGAGVANSKAAYALLSKVYLAWGWDAERANVDSAKTLFTRAQEAAEKVTNGTDLSSMTFAQKWDPDNENNSEVLFAVQYDRAGWPGDMKTGGHGLQNTFGSYYGDCTATGLKYSDGMHCPNPKAAYLWEEGDSRWEGTFMTEFYNAVKGGWDTEGYYAYYNVADCSTMPICLKYFNGNQTDAEISAYKTANASRLVKGDYANTVYIVQLTYPQVSVNGTSEDYLSFVNHGSTSGMYTTPSVRKFDDPNTSDIAVNTTNDYRDIVVLHLSDIYLVEAEAYLKAGNKPAAEEFINKVRARAGAPAVSFSTYKPKWHELDRYKSFQLQDIDLILDERARELYAEGHRWMDLHRTGSLKRYNVAFNDYLGSTSESQVKNYRPIPQAEINANNALTDESQNEEWK